jgi:hypothetical protein
VVFDGGSRGIGFDEKGEAADIPQRLESWQRAHDERFGRSSFRQNLATGPI